MLSQAEVKRQAFTQIVVVEICAVQLDGSAVSRLSHDLIDSGSLVLR